MARNTMHRLSIAMLLTMLLVSSYTSAEAGFDLTQYRGKVVVLDFWASWCVPCRRSFPWMNAMQEKYGADGLVIIGVNMDSDRSEAAVFLESTPAEFTIRYDTDGALASELDVVAMPSSYVFDRNGELITRHLGFKVKREHEYEAVISEALEDQQEIK